MAETYYVKPENSPVNDLTLNSGDAMFIANGGTANGAVVNSDGSATVNDGGSANNTTVNEGGTLHLIGGAATGVNVASNGRLEVNKGATATGIEAEKGATLVFDVAADTHIAGTSDGAAFQIQNGVATGFTLETGVLIVSDGGKAVETVLNSAGFINVSQGGSADKAVINTSGELKVSSGGTATEATVKTGGKLTVESSGFCDDATVEAGGNLYVVSSGGTAAGTYIGAMGNLAVSKGGTAYGTTVGAGGFLTVGTKGIAEGADVNGFLNVLEGGLASNVTVNEGAVVYVQSKGTGSDVSVDYGGILEVLADGRLKGATVSQGGSATIHAGVMASNVVIDGGKVTVMSDGWAAQTGVSGNTIVENGGLLEVEGGAHVEGAYVSAGGHVDVLSDGSFASALITNADVSAYKGAFVSRMNLEQGGVLRIESGASAQHLNVSAGGVLTGILREASELKFYGGTLDLNIAGVSPDSEALVDNISFTAIMPVAEDYLCTLTVSDTQAEGAYTLIEDATVFDKTITVKDTSGTTLGTLTVVEGTKTIGETKYTLAITRRHDELNDKDFDDLTVTIGAGGGVDLTGNLSSAFQLDAGMVGSSVNILDGGNLEVFEGGFTSQTTVNSGGDLSVSAGGSANVVTVNFGGDLFVRNGGIATLVKENGGYASVNDGATVTFVPNSFGGYNYNKADDWCTIHSGTTGTDLTVGNSGTIMVYSSGLAKNTTVNKDGKLRVSSGGIARDTTVNDGGLIEGSGCEIDGIVVNSGGSLLLYSGAKLTGQMTFASGAEVIPFVGSILDFDLTQTEPGSPALVNDLSILMGTPTYTLTVGASQAEGTYSLAGGATGFDKTITVKDTLGAELGTLTVAEGTKTIGETKYTLAVTTGNELTVTIGETSEPDTTPPTVTNIKASPTKPTNQNVTVTAEFTDNDKVATKQYRIGTSGAWMDYVDGVTMTENGTVYFRATDASGNESTGNNSIAVMNIDKVKPTITNITPNTTAPAKSVTVTADFSDNVGLKSTQYKIGDGAWTDYVDGVTVTENGTVYFKAVDKAGNDATAQYEVTNIEASTPENGPAEPKNNTLLIDKTTVNTDVTEAAGTTLTAAGQEILFDQTGAVDVSGYHNSVDKDDAIDYAKIVLKNGAKLSFHAEATAAATFTVYSLTEKNNKYTLKKLQTLKLTDKDKNGVFTADSPKQLSLSASGAYYVSMQFTDKDKSKTAYYNVTLNGEDSKTPSEFYPLGNNSDDWGDMKTAGYAGAVGDLGEIKDGTLYPISGEWAGFGDKVDCKKFTLNSAAELSLSVSAQDGPLKLSVCRLKATTSKKNGKTTTTYSQVTIKSVTVKAGQPKPLNSLRLAAGDYFFKAESTDVKKSTGYSVQITDGEFYTDGDGGWNNVLLDGKKLNENADHFYNNTLSTAGSIYLDKAGNDMNSSVAAEYGEEKYGGFVGFGDETDFAKLSLTETSDVKFTLEATNDATLEIFKVTEKDGKYSKKSVQTVKYKSGGEAVSSKKPVTLEVKDGVSYYVSVKATNIKKTTADPRTYYNVSYAVVPKDASSLSMPETDALASSLSMPDTLSLGQYDTDVLAGTSFDSASDKLLAESGAGLLASL